MNSVVRKLVLLPRYTTYVGARTYLTQPMSVRSFESADLMVFIGDLIGSNATLEIQVQESPDLEIWEDNANVYDAAGETTGSHTFRWDWMRLKVTLAGGDPAGSAWAVGNFVERAMAAQGSHA